VGFLRVASFDGHVADEIRTRVEELRKGGVDRLIVDVRGTAQGPVDNGIAAARLFVPTGTLVQRQGRGEPAVPIAAGPGDGPVKLPTVVLVTAGTSGAAEVFASALKGNDRADLVGEPTLGRAGLQKLVKFTDGSALLLTWARYLTPAGKAIHGTGLEPDERVDEPDVDFGDAPSGDDPILAKALERLAVRKAA
jgi:carboxyl-terminal processing protease